MAMKKKNVDWAALELAYRTGRSFRTLAREFSVSSTRIAQVAEQENWVRDLSAIIAEKSRAKLNAANLNRNLNGKRVSERAVVEATVQVQTEIVLAHRRDIQRGRQLVVKLFGHLEQEMSARLTEAPPAAAAGADEGSLCGKPVPLATQATTIKALGDALKTLIALERQAFNVDDGQPKRDAVGPTNTAESADSRAGFEDLRAAFKRVLSKASANCADGEAGHSAESRIAGAPTHQSGNHHQISGCLALL